MNDVQAQIANSDAFILEETKRIQYAYALKRETRYIIERVEAVASESVAEHIYGLHIIADYFLPIEDPNQQLDWMKVHDMLQYHDIDEIETGDKIGYLKTDAERSEEAAAMIRVIRNFPTHLQEKLQAVLTEYEAQQSSEAKFAKALDRIEPLFQLYNDNGKKILALQQTTSKQSTQIKEDFIKPFPYLYRFYRVLQTTMEKEGFFH